ncbi:hypothetical protein SCA6_010055 [Theobroma cacao]
MFLAYHNELVSKVSRLEEENIKLKKEKVESLIHIAMWLDISTGNITIQNHLLIASGDWSEKFEKIFHCETPDPKYQLRRTSSASF